MKEIIASIVTIIVGVAIVAWAISTGIDQQLVNDCNEWAAWEQEYKPFEANEETVRACKELGIKIVHKNWEF